MAVCSNYLVAMLYWWASNIEIKKKKEKNKNKRKEKHKIIANRIAMLLYFTFERVPVIFYHANFY